MRVPGSIAAFLLLGQSLAWAQWLNEPTPGIPRTADGKPDLTAPAPKIDGHPDLSGLWSLADPRPYPNTPDAPQGNNTIRQHMRPDREIVMLPWAEELYKRRGYVDLGAGRPSEHCLPHSLTDQYLIRREPFRIVQSRYYTGILFEEMTHFRNIYTDGRTHPADMAPAWFGYSVGKWERDTFVVETRGITDQSWLDDSGHPHTAEMVTIERFRRPDFGHLLLEIEVSDPKAYAKPLVLDFSFTFLADTDMIEDICENEKDSVHMRTNP